MIKRESPQLRPDRMPFFKAEIASDTFTFRHPTVGHFQPVMALMAKASEDDDIRGIECALGEFVLAAFADEVWVLESKTGGDAFDEIYDFGWTLEVVSTLFKHCAEILAASSITEDEVKEKVVFFKGSAVTGAGR